LVSSGEIVHFDWRKKLELRSQDWLPAQEPVRILVTSGASCPDAMVEGVIRKAISFFPGATPMEAMIDPWR